MSVVISSKEERIELAKRIVRLRAERCLSQKQLCMKAGISQRTMSDIENGHVWPYESTLECIAKALGVEVESLVPNRWL